MSNIKALLLILFMSIGVISMLAMCTTAVILYTANNLALDSFWSIFMQVIALVSLFVGNALLVLACASVLLHKRS